MPKMIIEHERFYPQSIGSSLLLSHLTGQLLQICGEGVEKIARVSEVRQI
jgi:hypothetical protein